MKIIITLSIITGLLLAETPIHTKMDSRISGKSFGGSLDDNIANKDGLGAIGLQHHTGSGEINNELKLQKILNNSLKSNDDLSNVKSSILSGEVETSFSASELESLGLVNDNPITPNNVILVKSGNTFSQGSYMPVVHIGSQVHTEYFLIDKNKTQYFEFTQAYTVSTWIGLPMVKYGGSTFIQSCNIPSNGIETISIFYNHQTKIATLMKNNDSSNIQKYQFQTNDDIAVGTGSCSTNQGSYFKNEVDYDENIKNILKEASQSM